MSERIDQARAEAERRYPVGPVGMFEPALRAAFQRGAEWADDNPQPRTITLAQCNDIEDAVHEGVPLGHMLRRLGIEVVDDE